MLLRSALGLFGLSCIAAITLVAPGCSDDDTSKGTPTPAPVDAGAADAEAAAPPAEPIEAEAGKWTWVRFEDSSCANGTPTGIGINKGTSKRVVVYLEGGGACWSEGTCNLGPLATNLDGFDETKFNEVKAKMPGSHLDRETEGNPYKDASLVYVPYCTGDVHGGDKEAAYGRKHVGRRNIAAFLKRLVPTFKDAERVTLSGSSAGGFGAALNYGRFAEAFAPVRVDLVDDSGPPFPAAKIVNYGDWSAAWDLAGAFPADCAGCADEPTKLFPYYLKKYPDARFTLLSYDVDMTIRNFYGFPQVMPAEDFRASLNDVTTATFDPSSNGRYFILQGSLHTMLFKMDKPDADPVKGNGDVTLAQFLTAMDTDETWTSVKPPAP